MKNLKKCGRGIGRRLATTALLAVLVQGCGDADTDVTLPENWNAQEAASALSTSGGKTAAPSDPGQTLEEAIAIARQSLAVLERIDGYTCLFVKRERVDGELLSAETVKLKLRHEPFSVYMRFLEPSAVKGREAIYVEGRNDNKIVGHGTGYEKIVAGTLHLDPNGYFAKTGNRYAITFTGIKNLLVQLVELGERENRLGTCQMRILEDEVIADRPCRCLEIRQAKPRTDFRLALARIYLDKEWNVPVRYEAYDWPDEAGKPPHLVEQYTYLNLDLDVELTDRDFDPTNPAYDYP